MSVPATLGKHSELYSQFYQQLF